MIRRAASSASAVAILIALALGPLACRSGGSAGAVAPVDPPRALDSGAGELAGRDSGALEGGAQARAARGEAGQGEARGRDEHWASFPEGSRCERLCARVFECVLDEGKEDEAGAASIELGCLRACVEGPELGPFGSCEAKAGCGDLLGCVRASWPASPEPPRPSVESPPSAGCRHACNALASCYSASQDEADRCVKRCREALPAEREAAIGECAEQDDCGELERCMKSFPGS